MADHEIHARLVVHDVNTMQPYERKCLVDWLYKLAHDFRTTPPEEFSRKFTARLFK